MKLILALSLLAALVAVVSSGAGSSEPAADSPPDGSNVENRLSIESVLRAIKDFFIRIFNWILGRSNAPVDNPTPQTPADNGNNPGVNANQ